ncbi:ABC transporter ATP-binding protein [Natrarchaeobius halalkaliphilus]|uniref:ABC transporter ATP-binding protein n=2 Tax=Natrarchaeobius halalkaliphilus TaxID=1679091 RepID=A0A3N6MX31_9EURY|nr:ABC transporter ATP-binding protein [Natrarchaeobius halalkaliphilus]RQG90052.1 ABC transporter ATP-binding protein [Natrarchaeobius halalkaliphilus]
MLELTDLHVEYEMEDGGSVKAVNGVSISLEEDKILGLIGESGSGKSTLAKAIIRLLAKNGHVPEGEIDYKGTDLTELSDRAFRKEMRWDEISMVPQNAMNGFDPVYTVGDQIVQAIRTHEDVSKADARERARELFEQLGIDPGRIDDYPHQFSGGMAQRAMIALALCLDPSLIIADEPTTALDVVIQDRILQTLRDLQTEFQSSIILITHDISVVSDICDDIAVMYGGRVVEHADVGTIIKEPRHPYTLGLRNAFPDIEEDDQDLISIPGTPPDLVDLEEGCGFAPRCPFATDECWDVTPEPTEYDDGHIVECHRADEQELLTEKAKQKETWMDDETDAALQVEEAND